MAASRPILHPATRRVQGARRHRAIQVGIVALSAALIPALFAVRALVGGGAQIYVMLVFVVGWAALALALLLFRCPQCGKPFHRDGAMLSAFNDRCLHCDFEIRTGGRGGNRRVKR